MENETQLNIIGYRGRAVPHLLYQQAREEQRGTPRRLAILLPGLGYSNDMPLMFYAHQAAETAGYDILHVNYAYNREPEWAQISHDEQTRWLYADTTAALSAALEAGQPTVHGESGYAQIVIIGKSLGTMAMANLLEQYDHLPPSRWVWLTPVLNDPMLRRNIRKHHPRSLVVIGTADHYYDFATLADLFQATEDRVEIIENANHGLIVPGDVHASLQALERAVEAMELFIK